MHNVVPTGGKTYNCCTIYRSLNGLLDMRIMDAKRDYGQDMGGYVFKIATKVAFGGLRRAINGRQMKKVDTIPLDTMVFLKIKGLGKIYIEKSAFVAADENMEKERYAARLSSLDRRVQAEFTINHKDGKGGLDWGGTKGQALLRKTEIVEINKNT